MKRKTDLSFEIDKEDLGTKRAKKIIEVFMLMNKETIEALLVLLYKLEEYDTCEAMLEIYKKYFYEERQPTLH